MPSLEERITAIEDIILLSKKGENLDNLSVNETGLDVLIYDPISKKIKKVPNKFEFYLKKGSFDGDADDIIERINQIDNPAADIDLKGATDNGNQTDNPIEIIDDESYLSVENEARSKGIKVFQDLINFFFGSFTFTLQFPTLTRNSQQTFQDKSGTIALLEDLPEVYPTKTSDLENDGNGGDSPFATQQEVQDGDEELDTRLTILENITPPTVKTGLTGQAYVVWAGEGLKYYATYPNYFIESVLKPANSGNVTLEPTTGMSVGEKRYDLIILDANGLNKITGIPDENPVLPTVNEDTQIILSNVLLNSGDIVPPGSTTKIEQIFDENIEWSVIKEGAVTIDPNYTVNPFKGSKCLRVTNFGSGREHISFNRLGNKKLTDFSVLSFRIYLPSNLSSNVSFDIWFALNDAESTEVKPFQHNLYGYKDNIKNTWQLVVIPLSNFQIRNIDTNRLVFRRSAGDVNFLIDDISLISAEQTVLPPEVSKQRAFTTIITDGGIVNATIDNDTFQIKGGGGTSVTSDGNKTILIDTGGLNTRVNNLENSTVRSAQNFYKDIDLDGEVTDLNISTTPMTSLNFVGTVSKLKSLFYPPLLAQPLDGLPFFIKNSQAIPITIENELLDELAGRYLFSFYDNKDLVIQPNQVIEFKNKSQADRGKIEFVGLKGVDESNLMHLDGDEEVDGNKTYLQPVSGVEATEPEHLVPLEQMQDADAAVLEAANSYTDSKIVGIYKFKGNKTDYADLIATTGMQVGDVYNLLSNEKNYGWTGTLWDDLGGTFDVSGKEDVSNKSNDIEADKASTSKYGSVKAFYDWAVGKFQSWILGINPIAGITYTIGIADYKTKNIFTSTNPVAFTVPTNASVAVPIGTNFSYIVQGAGTVTIGGAGITFVQKNLVYTTGDTFFLDKIDTNTWVVDGNLPVVGSLELKKCYLKGTGNDTSAIIGSGEKPFLTLEGLLQKFLSVYGNFDGMIIIILDNGNYVISEERTYSELHIESGFYTPTVRISNKTIISKKLYLTGNMTFEVNPKIGATLTGTYFFQGLGGASLYIKINEIKKGAEGGSPSVHFMFAGMPDKCFFEVNKLTGAGRFGFENVTGIQEFNIGTLTDSNFEVQAGNTKLVNVNIKSIVYNGTGEFSPVTANSSEFELKIGSISVTNATARVVLNFRYTRITLDGGLYENTIFNCGLTNTLDYSGYITGKGILEYKSALSLFASVFNCTGSGNTERSKHLKGVYFKDLDLIIRDTSSGAFLNAGYIALAVVSNGNQISPRFTFDNVRIEIKDSTKALVMSGFTASEVNNYNIVLFKNGCHIINPNGYLFEWRNSATGMTDAAGKVVLAQIGKSIIHDGLGLSTFPNVTMTDLSTY